MKVAKIITSIVVLLFLMGSCKKGFLDVVPKDTLTDATFWKTEKDADLALTGAYRLWETHRNVMWLDLMTDNGFSQFPHDNVQVMGNGQLNASSFGINYFDFTQIRKYNNFLEKIETVKMDENKKKRYKAEIRFLRAYDFFKKVEFYGDVPLVTTTIADPFEAKLARNPKGEVVAFILKELGEIAPILPVMNMKESKGHITRGSALALKARMELYEKMYKEAMEDAKTVMDMNVYELYPNYVQQFLVDNESNNKESILELIQIKDFYRNDIWLRMLPATEGGYSSITAVQSMVDTYEMANGKTIDDASSGYDPDKPFVNRDPRLAMTILHPGARFNGRYFNPLDPSSSDYHQNPAGPRSGYNVLKYLKVVPSSLLFNSDNNIIIIRLAEILLTYAEAAIEANLITNEVYDAIDKVRQRAGMPKVDKSVYDTQAKLRELIRRERRVELSFEGLRHWDIKRWDIGQEVMNGPLYGSREGSVNTQTGLVTWGNKRIKLEDRVFYPERKYLLPIPQAELDANPNIIQNPGY